MAATVAASFSAHAATYNGDLFIGFTTQSGKDLIYDIGQASTLFPGQTWNLSSSLTGAGITALGGAKWGVIGDKSVNGIRYAWSTSGNGVPPSIANAAVWGTVDTPTRSISSQFSTLGLNQSVTPDSSFDNSWNQQTIVGTLVTQYHNVYEDPNTSGLKTVPFYGAAADGSIPELVGTFSLGGNGVVSFVPEPGTFTLIGLGLLGFTLRGKIFRNS